MVNFQDFDGWNIEKCGQLVWCGEGHADAD